MLGNLTRQVSDVCETALLSLFWAPTDELAEMCFEFLPQNDWQINNGIFLKNSIVKTYQSWCVLKYEYTGWGPEQGFKRLFRRRVWPEV